MDKHILRKWYHLVSKFGRNILVLSDRIGDEQMFYKIDIQSLLVDFHQRTTALYLPKAALKIFE